MGELPDEGSYTELADLLDTFTEELPDGVVCVSRRELSLLVCASTAFALGIRQRPDPDPAGNEELWETLKRNGSRVGYLVVKGHMPMDTQRTGLSDLAASAAGPEGDASSPEEDDS